MTRAWVWLLLLATCPLTLAADNTPRVRDAWIREAPPGATVLAAYMVIENPGTQSVNLTAVSGKDVTEVMIHATQVVNGTARMTHLPQLSLPPRSRQSLTPGGTHLMLMGPRRALHVGDTVDLVLHFSDGRRLTVSCPVRRDAPDVAPGKPSPE